MPPGSRPSCAPPGTPERAASGQNYLKSKLEFSGTTVPAARAIITGWRRAHPDLTGQRLTGAGRGAVGRPGIRVQARRRHPARPTGGRCSTAADVPLVESFLRTSGTWALVDGLAADVMGSLVERAPELLATLDRWATDDDFWIRRSALLSLLVPLRRGDPTHFARFGRYADAMLAEREFFIRKAIGWVLRETGKRQPDLVADWLAPRARPGVGCHHARGGQVAARPAARRPADRLPGPERRIERQLSRMPAGRRREQRPHRASATAGKLPGRLKLGGQRLPPVAASAGGYAARRRPGSWARRPPAPGAVATTSTTASRRRPRAA